MEKRLTRKELVEYIKQIMPEDLSEIEKIAFIENEVAKQVSFDEKYLWGDTQTREKIYKLAKKEAQNPPEKVKRKLICVTMAELFGYVIKQFGFDVLYQKRSQQCYIKAGDNDIFNIISPQKLEHVCLLVGLSDEKYIEVDIQDDMARLQTNSRPKDFGSERHGTKISNGVVIGILDRHIVENVFRKIYGLKQDEAFTDEYIMALARRYKALNKTPIEMFESYMEDPIIKKQIQNIKCIEANKFYKAILIACYGFSINGKQFERNENRAIIEECILSDNEERKRYSFCIYAEDNTQKVFYVYSKKSKRMIKLTQEEIKQMMEQAINIETRGIKSDIKDNMISFINGDIMENINLDNKNSGVSLEDIFVEDEENEI